MLFYNAKRLTKDQKLVRSTVEQAQISKVISEDNFENVEQVYKLIIKYKKYFGLCH